MTVSIRTRQAYAATIPRVRKLSRPTKCEGWHGGSEGKRPCRNPANWSYRHLIGVLSGDGRTRRYCWNHLMTRGLYGSMKDEARTNRWIEKHPPPWGES
jgi:hypothetical protein